MTLNRSEYVRRDGVELAALVRTGEIEPGALLRTAIEVARSVNPTINAIAAYHLDDATADAAAVAPSAALAGVPFLVKDLALAMRGTVSRSGSRLPAPPPAARDSELMSRFRKAGLVTFGKTTTPEGGGHITTESALHGATRNPFALGFSAGGSSGGAAAAVAAGIVPLAHANDGLGSIRIPASACNLFGLKPTRQRTPTGPFMSDMLNGRGVEFAVTRTVRDAAVLLDAVHGPDLGAPSHAPMPDRSFADSVRNPDKRRHRIAFSTRCFSGAAVDPACADAVTIAAELCASLGHEVEERALAFDWHGFLSALRTTMLAGAHWGIAADFHDSGLQPSPDFIEPHNWEQYRLGADISAGQMLAAQAMLGRAQREVGRFFESADIVLTPVLSRRPASLGELMHHSPVSSASPGSLRLRYRSIKRRTGCRSACNLPAASAGKPTFSAWRLRSRRRGPGLSAIRRLRSSCAPRAKPRHRPSGQRPRNPACSPRRRDIASPNRRLPANARSPSRHLAGRMRRG